MSSWSKLDEARHRAQVSMRGAADRAIARASGTIDGAFTSASAAVMAAASEAAIERLRSAFVDVMDRVQGVRDANDR